MRMPTVSAPPYDEDVVRTIPARENSSSAIRPVPSMGRRYRPSEIAALSLQDINDLPREDLIAIIESVPSAFAKTQEADRLSERLDFLNRATLERLAFIARKCCCNQGY